MKNFTNFSVKKSVNFLAILMIFCLGLISFQAKAQNPEWMYFLEDVEINAIADAGGYVWVAAKTKQSFYNNVIYKLHKATESIIDSVVFECTDYQCFSMDVDINGNLWLSDRKSLAKYDGTNLTVWNKAQLAEIGLPETDITYLKTDKSGNVWIKFANRGLAMFDGTKSTLYNGDNTGLNFFFDSQIRKIDYNSDGKIWIATFGYGIASFDGTSWELFNDKNSDLPSNHFNDMELDSEDNIWLGTASNGLVKFDGVNCTVYNTENSEIPENKTLLLTIGNDDNIWFWSSPLSGLIKFDGENFTPFTVQNSGIKGNRIGPLFVDSDNNLWMYVTYVINNYKGINVYKEGGVIISSVEDEIMSVQDITIFPNPTTDFITIQFSNKGLKHFFTSDKVQIFDMLGLEIMSELIHPLTGSHRMNVESLSSGVYFIRIGNKVEKFIKM